MSKYKSAPAVVISAEQIEELEQPFVVDAGGKQYALKSVNAFSIDDFSQVADIAMEDVSKLPPLIAYDKDSEKFLRTCGAGLLKAIVTRWMDSQGVTLGESESSAD